MSRRMVAEFRDQGPKGMDTIPELWALESATESFRRRRVMEDMEVIGADR